MACRQIVHLRSGSVPLAIIARSLSEYPLFGIGIKFTLTSGFASINASFSASNRFSSPSFPHVAQVISFCAASV